MSDGPEGADYRPEEHSWAKWAPALLVGGMSIVAYLNALGGGFVNDAFFLIVQNQSLLESKEWLAWFTRDYYWGSSHADTTLYRPLTILSFLLHVRTTGVRPLPFILGNLLLHTGASLLVLGLGTRLLGRLAALVGALLFAVHPLHTEAVAWMVGRSELLAALFALAACAGFLRATESGEPHPWRLTLGVVGAYLAALLSKEHVALLPLWFGLAWYLDRPRRSGKPAVWIGVGCVLAVALFLLLRAQALTRQAEGQAVVEGLFNPAAVVSAPLRWLTAAAAVWRYTLLFFWPARLSSDYSYAQTQVSTGLGLAEAAGILVIVAVLAGIILAWRRVPGVALALALAPISFFLVSNFPFPIGTVMAERLTYLPSVGLCLVAGWLLTLLPLPSVVKEWGHRATAEPGPGSSGRDWPGSAVITAILVLSLVLFGRTLARNTDWKDAYTLAASALRASPRSASAQASMGFVERGRGNNERAMELLQESLRTYPNNPSALNALGGIFMDRRNFGQAVELYRKAVALQPRASWLRSNLGIALQRLGDLTEAERELNEAIRLGPRALEPRLALGGLLLETRRPAEALQQFQEAARLSPRDPIPLYGIATASLELGDRQTAEAYARRAAAQGFPVPEAFWRSIRPRSEDPNRGQAPRQ